MARNEKKRIHRTDEILATELPEPRHALPIDHEDFYGPTIGRSQADVIPTSSTWMGAFAMDLEATKTPCITAMAATAVDVLLIAQKVKIVRENDAISHILVNIHGQSHFNLFPIFGIPNNRLLPPAMNLAKMIASSRLNDGYLEDGSRITNYQRSFAR